MGMESAVVVSITGDASGVAPAVEQTRASLGNLEPILAQLNATMGELSGQMKAAMATGASMGAKLSESMHQARAATESETNALGRMVAKVHEGAESVRTFQTRAKEFAEVYVAMFAVERVRHWAESIGSAAEKLRNLSTELGISVNELQHLQGVADQTGVPLDTITKAVGLMDRNLFNSAGKTTLQANAFKSLGISANDGRTNMEKLSVIADKLKNMDEGPKRAALAFAVFGKSGLAMIPVLEKGSAGLAEYNKKTKEYGAVSDDAQAKGLALAEATNESKLAFAGFGNVMASQFAPLLKSATDSLNSMIKSFVESYREGGTAKVILEAISGTIRVMGAAFQAAGAILRPFGDAIKFVADNIEIIAPIAAGLATLMAGPYVVAFASATIATIAQTDAMVALRGALMLDGVASAAAYAIELLAGGMTAAAAATWEFTVALLANPLTWVAVAIAGVTAGLTYLAMHTRTVSDAFTVMKDVALMALEWIKSSVMALGGMLITLAKIEYDAFTMQWGKIQGDWQAGLDGLAQKVAAFDNKIKSLHDDMMAHLAFGGDAAAPKPAAMPKMPGSFNPELGATAKAPKGKTGGAGETLTQKLEAQLETKKTAWAKEQDAQGTAQAFSLQSEADFWAAALNRAHLGAKDKLAIEKKWLAARQALQKEAISEQIEVYKSDIEEAGKNWAEKLSILKAEEAFVRRMYGAGSKEAEAARNAVVKAEREKADQIKAIDNDLAQHRGQLALMNIDEAENSAKQQVALGRATEGQLLAQERQFEAQRFAILRAGLLAERGLVDPFRDPQKYAQVNQQIESLERQHQNKLTQIDRQAAMQRTQIQRGAINQVGQSFGDHISKMITLQEGWRQGLVGIYQGLVSTVANVVQQIVQKWVAAFLTKLILGKQEAAQSAANYVGQAGAGGVASMAAAPFPMNLTAPAFGASMAAAAAAFGAVPAYDVGAWDLSKDQLAMVHSGEMIIPANLAGGLRSMFKTAGGGGQAMFGGRADATKASSKSEASFHYSPTINHSSMDLKQAVHRDSRDMRKWFMNQVRNGSLKPAST